MLIAISIVEKILGLPRIAENWESYLTWMQHKRISKTTQFCLHWMAFRTQNSLWIIFLVFFRESVRALNVKVASDFFMKFKTPLQSSVIMEELHLGFLHMFQINVDKVQFASLHVKKLAKLWIQSTDTISFKSIMKELSGKEEKSQNN